MSQAEKDTKVIETIFSQYGYTPFTAQAAADAWNTATQGTSEQPLTADEAHAILQRNTRGQRVSVEFVYRIKPEAVAEATDKEAEAPPAEVAAADAQDVPATV